jgi:hypothetical protein
VYKTAIQRMLPEFDEKGALICWTMAALIYLTNLVCQFSSAGL